MIIWTKRWTILYLSFSLYLTHSGLVRVNLFQMRLFAFIFSLSLFFILVFVDDQHWLMLFFLPYYLNSILHRFTINRIDHIHCWPMSYLSFDITILYMCAHMNSHTFFVPPWKMYCRHNYSITLEAITIFSSFFLFLYMCLWWDAFVRWLDDAQDWWLWCLLSIQTKSCFEGANDVS